MCEIEEFFAYVDRCNYYGVLGQHDRVACQVCIVCRKDLIDLDEFVKYGPAIGGRIYFCLKHQIEYARLVKTYGDRAREPLRVLESNMLKYFKQKYGNIRPEWQYLGELENMLSEKFYVCQS